MTAFYLHKSNHGLLNRLLHQIPNITMFDVTGILDQVRSIIGRVILDRIQEAAIADLA